MPPVTRTRSGHPASLSAEALLPGGRIASIAASDLALLGMDHFVGAPQALALVKELAAIMPPAAAFDAASASR